MCGRTSTCGENMFHNSFTYWIVIVVIYVLSTNERNAHIRLSVAIAEYVEFVKVLTRDVPPDNMEHVKGNCKGQFSRTGRIVYG